MKFLNEVPFLKAGIILLVMPASQTFAIEPNQVYLAQVSAWQCRLTWAGGGTTLGQGGTRDSALQDLNRQVSLDRVNNNGQNYSVGTTCYTLPVPGGSSPSTGGSQDSNSGSNSNSCASSGFNSCTRASVDRIYRDVLGRGSDPGGLDSWSFAVDSRKLSLNEVRYRIAFDTESTNNVTAIYREVLGRNPDAGGLDSWRGGLANGLSLQEVRSRIALDTESRNNIQRLYSSIFRKEASSEEVHSYALRLAREGWTLDRVNQDMINRSKGR